MGTPPIFPYGNTPQYYGARQRRGLKVVFFPMLFLRPAMLRGTAGESLILYFVAVAADVFLTPPSFNPLALWALPLYSL